MLEGMATFAEKMEPQTGCLLRACNGAAVKGARRKEGGHDFRMIRRSRRAASGFSFGSIEI